LTNGIIEQDGNGQQQVRIFCDEAREKEIYAFIEQTDPSLISFLSKIKERQFD
jgi:hypothetical protein